LAVRRTIRRIISAFRISIIHGRRSRGEQGGQVPPPELGAGDANANCPPPRFCHVGTQMSVLWPKSVFGRGSAPDPVGEAHDAPPDPLVGWRGDTPPHTPPHSARTHLWRSPCVPPRSPARSTPMRSSTCICLILYLCSINSQIYITGSKVPGSERARERIGQGPIGRFAPGGELAPGEFSLLLHTVFGK